MHLIVAIETHETRKVCKVFLLNSPYLLEYIAKHWNARWVELRYVYKDTEQHA